MIAIVVPVYKEEKSIERFIRHLYSLDGDFKVYIAYADGGDATLDVLHKLNKEFPFKVVMSEKSRSIQMNTGFKETTEEKIMFLHADSYLDKDAIVKMDKALDKYSVAAINIKFTSKRFLMKVVAFRSNLRLKLYNIAYGDQAMSFRREKFIQMGMFKELPLMEDYEMSRRLKKEGTKIKAVDSYVTTDARRFEQTGILKTIILMKKLKFMFLLGYQIEEITRRYRDER